MKHHNTEQVTALLDGQLTGVRRWLVQRHVNRCVLCANEYRHQHHVREMLKDNPLNVEMSDSADFFWSQVKRGIEAAGNQTERIPVPHLSMTDWLGQHILAVASATATVIVIVGAVFVLQERRREQLVFAHYVPQVEHVSTMMPNTVATPYKVPDSGISVIWVSGLPWSSDMQEMQTTFADSGS